MMAFFSSFRQKEILITVAADLIFILLLVGIFFGFTTAMEQQSTALEFQSFDELQAALADPLTGETTFKTIQTLFYTLTGGLLLLVLSFFVLWSATRYYIWNRLLERNTRYTKWLLLGLVAVVLFILYLVPAVLVQQLFAWLFSFIFPFISSQPLQKLIMEIVFLGIFSFFFFILFLILYRFTKTGYLWSSIGDGFSLLSKNWRVWLHGWGVGAVLILFLAVLSLFTRNIYIVVAFFLLYYSWFRSYVVQNINHNV